MNTWQYLSLWSLAPYPCTLFINCFIFVLVWQLFRAVLCPLELRPAQSGVEVPDCQQLSSVKSSTHAFGLVTDASVISLDKTTFSNSPTHSKFCHISQETEISHSPSKSFGAMLLTYLSAGQLKLCSLKVLCSLFETWKQKLFNF